MNASFILKILWKYVWPVLRSIFATLSSKVMDKIFALVQEANAHADWTNDQKYDYVYKGMKAWLKEQKKEIKDSWLNFLIELIVNFLKLEA